MTTISLNPTPNFEPAAWLVRLCIALVIFEIVMKGITLYKAGNKRQVAWFVCIFIFNTCGILPIIYLIINKYKDRKTK